MNEAQTGASSALFGSRRHTRVSRGLSEFHGRRPVLFTATGEAVLALPVEGLDRQRLFEFMALCGPVAPQLIITERRALAKAARAGPQFDHVTASLADQA
jgi:GTP cyclohydrolase II